jgi:MYXO-CTERM domain-containing protein
MRTLIAISAAALVAAAPGLAAASPIFPGAIQTDLTMTQTPPCTICHATNAGGTGTVVQKFGIAMRARGLVPLDTNSLQAALTQMDKDKVDSDCDGTPDIEQLKMNRDPNTGLDFDGTGTMSKACPVADGGAGGGGGGGGSDVLLTPAYGCGAQLAPGPTPLWQGAAAVAAVLGLAFARRRRR